MRSVRIFTCIAAGNEVLQLRQKFLDAIDDSNNIRARLTLNVQNHRGIFVGPRSLLHILRAVKHRGHIREPHRRRRCDTR